MVQSAAAPMAAPESAIEEPEATSVPPQELLLFAVAPTARFVGRASENAAPSIDALFAFVS